MVQLQLITPLEIRHAYHKMAYIPPIAAKRKPCKFVVKYRHDKRITCTQKQQVVVTNPYGKQKTIQLPGRITIQYQYNDLKGKHRATLHNFGTAYTAAQAQFMWEQAWVVLEREVLDFDEHQLEVITDYPRLPEYECVIEKGNIVYKKRLNSPGQETEDQEPLDQETQGQEPQDLDMDWLQEQQQSGNQNDDSYDLWQVESTYGFN